MTRKPTPTATPETGDDYFCLFCRRWTWQATCPKCGRPTRYDAPQPDAKPMTTAEQNAHLAKLVFGGAC